MRRESTKSQMRNAIQQILPTSASQKSFALHNRKSSNAPIPQNQSMQELHQVDKSYSKSDPNPHGAHTLTAKK